MVKVKLPISTVVLSTAMAGTPLGRGETPIRNTFCRMIATPKAVSSPVVAGARRTGQKATRSSSTAVITTVSKQTGRIIQMSPVPNSAMAYMM